MHTLTAYTLKAHVHTNSIHTEHMHTLRERMHTHTHNSTILLTGKETTSIRTYLRHWQVRYDSRQENKETNDHIILHNLNGEHH